MALLIQTIQNTSANPIQLFIPGYSANQAPVVINPGASLDLLSVLSSDEVMALQDQLQRMVGTGIISVVASVSPKSLDVATILQWILSTDLYCQFAGGVDGKNGISTTNHYSGSHNTPVTIPIEITNGFSVKSLMNDFSTVVVSLAGGSASNPTLNGGAGPVLLSTTEGAMSLMVNATSAGTVLLHLSSPTHPYTTLLADIDATVTLA